MQITHWLLLLCWVVPHALLFLPAQPQKRWILFSTGVILLCFLYLLKPSTSDLPGYSVYFSSGFLTVNPYDVTATGAVELDPVDTTGTPFRQTFSKSPAFAVLAEAMSLIYPPGPFLPRISPIQERYVSDFPVITITLVGCVVLLVACREFARGAGIRACFDKEFWLGNLFLVLGSVFFLLGSQNTLRQFLGIALIFSCLALFSRKKYGSAIVSGLVGCLMHHWIVVFLLFLGYLWAVLHWLSQDAANETSRLGGWRPVLIGLISGVGLLAVVKGIVLGLGSSMLEHAYFNWPFVPELKAYSMVDLSQTLNRSDPVEKMLVIGFSFLLSEFILGRQPRAPGVELRLLRSSIFFVLIPLVIYPEILSRVLMLYFACELFFLCSNLTRRGRAAWYATATVFLFYGFAPNAINIVMGTGWLNRYFMI